MLDLLLLRTWHVKKELRQLSSESGDLNVVDAGSGFGQYVYYMARKNRNWKIKGVDVKQEQIDDCNQFFSKIGFLNTKFEYADLTKFSNDTPLDLIITIDVMEHIEEDVKVFENFYNSMKEGASLLISTPSDQGGSDVHHDHDHDHDEDGEHSFIDEHVRDGYNIDEIREKLESVGFKNIDARYSYGKPGKLSWKLSMKYPLLMLNASKLFFVVLPFYYIITFPLCLILNRMDVIGNHKTGTGLIVRAKK
jgi:2-polyprenyl-3-methyl-5-hydroxy-6-metoxy-1,4-benzoquinol methylase